MKYTFIDYDKNDTFSSLRGIDLRELLAETENYLLEYRDKLNLSSKLTFGIELEYERFSKTEVTEFINSSLKGWISKYDGSLYSGGEINSPIMKDKTKSWRDLKNICDYLSSAKADTAHHAGGHIHIGASILAQDADAWRKFLKLYTAYENVTFRFAFGDKISGRREIIKYATPVADELYAVIDDINQDSSLSTIHEKLPNVRNRALNFTNVCFDKSEAKNTLEFRCPNATTNEVVWQNNINTFANMLIVCGDKVVDEEFLDYKLNNEYLSYGSNRHLYNEINLKNALEFVDLVFDNNLDKVYFLRQYLRDFQENYGLKGAVKAKKFVKQNISRKT